MAESATVRVRSFEDADLDTVVGLLGRALGPAPGGVDRRALFEWKHLGNPFGRSLALVAEAEGRVIGLRAFMRWRLRAAGEEIAAVRAVDTATDPGARRRGVFSSLTEATLETCREEEVGFVFNTPNEKSLPGYLKMGWSVVTRWPVAVRARRPLAVLLSAVRRDLRAGGAVAPPAGSALVTAGEFLDGAHTDLFLEAAVRPEVALHTSRSPLYLRWRYAAGPMAYHVLVDGEPPTAAVIVRLRSRGRLREAVVCEALHAPGADEQLRAVLRDLPRAAGADHAVAAAAPGWPGNEVVPRAGYRRVPRAGMTFTVRPVAGGGPDPLSASSWALTLGDLEVF